MQKIVTVVEGRDEDVALANELRRAAVEAGWGFRRLVQVESQRVSENNLDDLFSDYVIWRALASNNRVERFRIRQFLNNSNRVTMNSHVVGEDVVASNKYFQQGIFMNDPILKNHTLPMYEAFSVENLLELVLEEKLKYPFVLKTNYGTAGKGTVLISNEDELVAYDGEMDGILAEPYVEADGDWRVFVLGGVALGAIRKSGHTDAPGDFVTKSKGAIISQEANQAIKDILSQIAVRAAAASKMEYAEVDIMHDRRTNQFYVVEANIAAGWNGLKEACGIDMAKAMIEWLDERGRMHEQSTERTVTNYVKKRLQYLTVEARDKLSKVLAWKPECLGDLTRFNDEYRGDLATRIEWVYRNLMFTGSVADVSVSTRFRTGALLEEIANTPLSWMGNYIDVGLGTLDESIMTTAMYLAILEKYDKMIRIK